MLGTLRQFNTDFGRAIERHRDVSKADELKRITAPFIMRRLKADPGIADELPKKVGNVCVRYFMGGGCSRDLLYRWFKTRMQP